MLELHVTNHSTPHDPALDPKKPCEVACKRLAQWQGADYEATIEYEVNKIEHELCVCVAVLELLINFSSTFAPSYHLFSLC